MIDKESTTENTPEEVEESDSEDEIRQPTLRDNPQLIIIAHNGFNFCFFCFKSDDQTQLPVLLC